MQSLGPGTSDDWVDVKPAVNVARSEREVIVNSSDRHGKSLVNVFETARSLRMACVKPVTWQERASAPNWGPETGLQLTSPPHATAIH